MWMVRVYPPKIKLLVHSRGLASEWNMKPCPTVEKDFLLVVSYPWSTVSQRHMAERPEGLYLMLRISIMSPTDARVTHPFGFGPIPDTDAKESHHEVTMSGLTILHNPPPAGPKELTDLISCLNNCGSVWHVADLDVCERTRVCVCGLF